MVESTQFEADGERVDVEISDGADEGASQVPQVHGQFFATINLSHLLIFWDAQKQSLSLP